MTIRAAASFEDFAPDIPAVVLPLAAQLSETLSWEGTSMVDISREFPSKSSTSPCPLSTHFRTIDHFRFRHLVHPLGVSRGQQGNNDSTSCSSSVALNYPDNSTFARSSMTGEPIAELLQQAVWLLGVDGDADEHSYNFLMTNAFFLVVPRSRETVSLPTAAEATPAFCINGLAFAGAVVVSNQAHLDMLESKGVQELLCEVTIPCSS